MKCNFQVLNNHWVSYKLWFYAYKYDIFIGNRILKKLMNYEGLNFQVNMFTFWVTYKLWVWHINDLQNIREKLKNDSIQSFRKVIAAELMFCWIYNI